MYIHIYMYVHVHVHVHVLLGYSLLGDLSVFALLCCRGSSVGKSSAKNPEVCVFECHPRELYTLGFVLFYIVFVVSLGLKSCTCTFCT